jgi:hypothetical protein
MSLNVEVMAQVWSKEISHKYVSFIIKYKNANWPSIYASASFLYPECPSLIQERDRKKETPVVKTKCMWLCGEQSSRNVDLFDIAFVKLLRQVGGISDLALSGADLFVQSQESASSIDSTVR